MGDQEQFETGSREDQATAWFVRLQSDAATEGDYLDLTAWLEASPDHADAYDKVERLWLEIGDHADALRSAAPQDAVILPFAPRPPRPAARMASPGVRIAAGIGLAVVLGTGVALTLFGGGTETAYQTATGETRTVGLADGSTLDLGPATRVSIRMSPLGRRATLDRGEAIFDVAKDPRRPFTVEAGERRIRVVGTRFDVLRDDGRLVVAVARGIVEVRPSAPGSGTDPVRLLAGDELRHQAGTAADVLSRGDPQSAMAWRRGSLVYRDRPLAEVVSDLNRYFRIPIRLEGGASTLRFSGVLMLDHEPEVIGRLQALLPVHAEEAGGVVRIRPSRPAA